MFFPWDKYPLSSNGQDHTAFAVACSYVGCGFGVLSYVIQFLWVMFWIYVTKKFL